MIEKLVNGRSTLKREGTSLIIKISSKNKWNIRLFVLIWFVSWVSAIVLSIGHLFTNQSKSEILLFSYGLFFWITIGSFILYLFLWNAGGYETIVANQSELIIKRNIFGIRFSEKSYEMNSITNMEVNPDSTFKFDYLRWRGLEMDILTGGKIRFIYKRKRIKFGYALFNSEAIYLINQILKQKKDVLGIS